MVSVNTDSCGTKPSEDQLMTWLQCSHIGALMKYKRLYGGREDGAVGLNVAIGSLASLMLTALDLVDDGVTFLGDAADDKRVNLLRAIFWAMHQLSRDEGGGEAAGGSGDAAAV